MTLPEKQAELLELIDAAHLGVIQPEQVARLEALLKGDPEAQWFYLRQVDLYGNLAWTCSAEAERDALSQLRTHLASQADPDEPSPDENGSLLMEAIEIDARARAQRRMEREAIEAARQREEAERLDVARMMFGRTEPVVPVRHLVIPRAVAYGAVAAIVVLIALLMWPTADRVSPQPSVVSSPEMSAFTLNGQVDAIWAAGGEPRGIFQGAVQQIASTRRLQLQSGWVELLSRQGARIIVEGPATFELASTEELTLHLGKLSAFCPPGAEGLAVVTSRGRVVDLGTRFGVVVAPQQDVEIHVFDGAVDAQSVAGQHVRLDAGDLAIMERERVVAHRRVIDRSAWQFVNDLAEARRRQVVEVPFSHEVRYVYRDSYLSHNGSPGTYRLRDGALVVEPGPGNTASVFLPTRQHVLEVGDIWAVDVELNHSKGDSLGAYVTISADFVQPGRATDRFERRNVPGLLVRRTTLDGGVIRVHTVLQRGEPPNDLQSSGGDGLSDPGGRLTIIVHRIAADRFAFYLGVAETGELISLGERTHSELTTFENLCLGFECYSMRGSSTAVFSRLRRLEQVAFWRVGDFAPTRYPESR